MRKAENRRVENMEVKNQLNGRTLTTTRIVVSVVRSGARRDSLRLIE